MNPNSVVVLIITRMNEAESMRDIDDLPTTTDMLVSVAVSIAVEISNRSKNSDMVSEIVLLSNPTLSSVMIRNAV